jgi:hypothetical protein
MNSKAQKKLPRKTQTVAIDAAIIEQCRERAINNYRTLSAEMRLIIEAGLKALNNEEF